MKTYQVTVASEDVTKTVNDGIGRGWTFINAELQSDGKMLLTFDTDTSALPEITPAQPKQQKRRAEATPGQIILLIILVLGCLVYYAAGGEKETPDDANDTNEVAATNTPRPAGPVAPPTREVLTLASLPNHVSNIMDNMDFDVTSIESNASTITAYAPSTSDDYDDIGDYRMAYIGGLSGALINFFNDARTDAEPPQTIVVNFGNGRQVSVRVSYQYADALRFYNGSITANQFVATWDVD